MPPVLGVSPVFWRVNRAEYNTRKGNKPSRLDAIVESRHLIDFGETTKRQGGITMSAQSHTTVTPVVSVVNNRTITTSLNVAEAFEKNHRDVLRAIRNLEILNDFRERNFAHVEIIEENAINGKTRMAP
jgi:hypothetical protein